MEPKYLAITSTSTDDSSKIASELSPDYESENADIIKCLNTVERIVCKLKSNDNDTFVDALEKLLALAKNEDRKKQLQLVNTLLSNMFEATTEELRLLQQEFTKIFEMKIDKRLIVDDDAIQCIEFLGAGAFGIVSSGILRRPGKTQKNVAIKKSKELCNGKLIQYEASILSRLNHENILKIYAINKSTTEIAIELMHLGNLEDAVEKFKFSKANILRILNDVANGMEYLSGKNYLHRDLACRNVFLNTRKQCKIGDFSFCVYVGNKDGVYIETERIAPDYNIPPETLVSKEFRVETDVWAMGILAWELFYTIEHANKLPPASFTKMFHLHRFLTINATLPKPTNCPKKFYMYIIDRLLNEDPKIRPPFSNIKAKITEIILDKH